MGDVTRTASKPSDPLTPGPSAAPPERRAPRDRRHLRASARSARVPMSDTPGSMNRITAIDQSNYPLTKVRPRPDRRRGGGKAHVADVLADHGHGGVSDAKRPPVIAGRPEGSGARMGGARTNSRPPSFGVVCDATARRNSRARRGPAARASLAGLGGDISLRPRRYCRAGYGSLDASRRTPHARR